MSKNVVVLQSLRPVCFPGLLYELESWRRCAGSKSKQAKKSETSFFQCPYVGLQQKMWLRLMVCTSMPRLGPCFLPGWPWIQMHLPQSVKINSGCVLPCLGLSISWPLCLKISMSRSKSKAYVFYPQDLDHRGAQNFWIVVRVRCSQFHNIATNNFWGLAVFPKSMCYYVTISLLLKYFKIFPHPILHIAKLMVLYLINTMRLLINY